MSSGRKRSSTDPLRPTKRWPPVAFTMLVCVAVVLPFETPLVRLGPLTVTTCELAIYLLLATWALGVVARGARAGLGRAVSALWRDEISPSARDPIGRAVAVWIAVTVLAGLAAPSERIPALKFALRALSGGLLFFCARELAGTAARIRTVAIAILAGAFLSAAAAVVESMFPSTATLWRAFRAGTFSVTGLVRPSGPFAYPTIAAMYWEAALPLAVTVPLTARVSQDRGGDRGGAPRIALALGGAGLLILAILASATRTAFAVAVLGSVALVVVLWRRGRAQRIASVGTLAIVVALTGLTLASPGPTSQLAMRLRWWQDGSWYRARYHLVEKNLGKTLAITAGTRAEIIVDVQNTGELTWPHDGRDAVQLSYHWENTDARGTHLQFEGVRSPLAGDVAPGAVARIAAQVQAPDAAGRYRLRWDLLREGVTWFSALGNVTGDQDVDIVAAGPAPPDSGGSQTGGNQTGVVNSSLESWNKSYVATRPGLWQAAVQLWRRHPVLGVGPDNFRRLYPDVMSAESGNPPAFYDQRIHANSLYFETLADMGIAGIIALALLMAALWSAGWSRVTGRATPLALGCVFAVATFFVHGFLDCFLAFTPTYGLTYLLLALVAAGEPLQKTRPR